MPEKIRITTDGKSLFVDPVTRLGNSFRTYLAASNRAGARFDPARRCQRAPQANLQNLIRELSVSGFEIEIDERLSGAIEEQRQAAANARTAAKGLHDAALVRMERIDAELTMRGLALYGYQHDGIRWLSHRKSALLCDEMGLGKTVQALIAAPEDAPVLVVAPAAVKGVWARETRRWRPDLGWPRILNGRRSFRWPSSGEIVITNPDILPAPVVINPEEKDSHRHRYGLPEWVHAPKPGTVVIYDEVHWAKNPRAQRTKAARLLSDAVHASGGFMWGLTGTPLLNRKDELWYVLHILRLGKEAYGSKKEFDRGWKWDGTPRPEIAERLQRVSLMRRREEVLPDLPTYTVEYINVDIDEDTIRLADEFIEKLAEAGVDLDRIKDCAELARATKGSRLSIGEISKVRAALAMAKSPAMISMVEAFESEEQPVVAWSAYRGPVDVLSARDGWARITGSETGDLRTRTVDQFAAGKFKGVACTIRAAGVGIDGLQRASHNAIFCDLDWTPGWNEQARDRICRIGQDRGVNVYILVANHVLDQRLMEILTFKTAVINESVHAAARKSVEEQFAEDVHAAHPDPVSIASVAVIADAEAQKRKAQTEALMPLPKLWDLFQSVVHTGVSRPALAMKGLELRTASVYSKYAGAIQVTNGIGYGRPGNEYYGRIDADGLHKRGDCPEAAVARLKRWEGDLMLLAADARAYGIATGSCCFCSLQLTDARSVTAGYGPICAGRWGLPWGDGEEARLPVGLLDLLPPHVAGSPE